MKAERIHHYEFVLTLSREEYFHLHSLVRDCATREELRGCVRVPVYCSVCEKMHKELEKVDDGWP